MSVYNNLYTCILLLIVLHLFLFDFVFLGAGGILSHEISNHNNAHLQCTVLNIPICKNEMGKIMYYFIYNNKRLTHQSIIDL